MQVSFNIIDFVLFAFALQGFVIAGLLFYSSKNIVSNRWLGALIFIVSEAVTMIELDNSGIWSRYAILSLLIVPTTLAIGPVVYFYTRSLIFEPRKFTWKNGLHFLPVLLEMKQQFLYLLYICGMLYILFVQHFYFKTSTQDLLFGGFSFVPIISCVSLTIYLTVTYVTITRHQKSGVISANKLKDLRWVKNMLRGLFTLAALWLYTLSTNVFGWPQYVLLYSAIGLVYLLGMAAWRRQAHMTSLEKEEYTCKPAKLYFTDTDAGNYANLLTKLMEVDQLYLNPLLKVDDVAAEMSVSEKMLSSLLNQHMGKNFNDFVNQYRVAEVKQRLANLQYHNFTIAAIAFDCGFNSLATFQRVFKQFTGITPSKFQNELLSPQIGD